jgi:nitrate reductase NapE component
MPRILTLLNMQRFATVVLFLFIAFFIFGIISAGSHGHIMFRTHMTEDWLSWGGMVISPSLAIYFLVKKTSQIKLLKSN